MDLEGVLAYPPLLHADRTGSPVSWGASGRLLRYLDDSLHEGDVTLETGAGISTIVFAINRCHHTAIVPDAIQAEKIKEWCEDNKVATDRLSFIIDTSQNVLPDLEIAPSLDVCLIDGAHGFPLPFIDWFYMGQRLKPGGLVLVDDVQIWTGRVLRDFLSKEPHWVIDHAEPFEFFAARRTTSAEANEWDEQPFVLHRSYTTNSTSLPRRACGSIFIFYRLGLSALTIARRRDWNELRRRISAFKSGGYKW
jgi:predicted O-methyltransferase YrrM